MSAAAWAMLLETALYVRRNINWSHTTLGFKRIFSVKLSCFFYKSGQLDTCSWQKLLLYLPGCELEVNDTELLLFCKHTGVETFDAKVDIRFQGDLFWEWFNSSRVCHLVHGLCWCSICVLPAGCHEWKAGGCWMCLCSIRCDRGPILLHTSAARGMYFTSPALETAATACVMWVLLSGFSWAQCLLLLE